MIRRRKNGRFIKSSTRKPSRRRVIKRRAPTRAVAVRRRRTTRRRTSRARTVYRRSAAGFGRVGRIFRSGVTGQVVSGIGGGYVGSAIASRLAPQYTTIGALAGGFLAGGIPGVIAAFITTGGGLGGLGSLIGQGPAPAGGQIAI